MVCAVCLQARKAAERDDTDVPPVPVTVRQLEALIRISEAFAKMTLQVRRAVSNDLATDRQFLTRLLRIYSAHAVPHTQRQRAHGVPALVQPHLQ